MLKQLLSVISASVALAGTALAQDLTIKAPPPDKATWIVNATIHTISGDIIPRGSVEIRTDGTIGEVLASAPSMPQNFAELNRVIDANGKHIYPGLISANTQLGLTEVQAMRASVDIAETGDITPEVRAAVAVNPDSTLLPVTRSNGVLVAGVMPLGGLVPGRASVMQLEGWTWEDMAVDDDAGMIVNWPGMRLARGWWVTETPDKQKERRKNNLDAIDRAFRTAKAYLAAKKADADVPTDLRWEAMRGVFERAEPVFIRAEELEQIQSAVSWAIGLGLKPVIVGGRDAPLCAELLKRHDVGVIVGGTKRFPTRDDSGYDQPFALPSELERLGVRWCLATGGPNDDTAHERNFPYHAALAVAHGLDHQRAIEAVTLGPAKMMGVADKLGSIEKGKHATLIVTDGSPLELTTKIEHAFVRGREIDLSNKQTELDKKYREKYRQLGVTR